MDADDLVLGFDLAVVGDALGPDLGFVIADRYVRRRQEAMETTSSWFCSRVAMRSGRTSTRQLRGRSVEMRMLLSLRVPAFLTRTSMLTVWPTLISW